jgi:hypothetical protein
MDFSFVGPLVASIFALGGALLKAFERNLGAAAAYAAVSILALVAAVEKL